MYIPALKTKYNDEIVPALMKEFGYKTIMQVPKLKKIVINQGVGQAIADKKLLEFGVKELIRYRRTESSSDYFYKGYLEFQAEKKYADRYNGDITEGKDV